MKKLDESAVLWLKKWAGTLTESEHSDFLDKMERPFNVNDIKDIKYTTRHSDSSEKNVVLDYELISDSHSLSGEVHLYISRDEGGMGFYVSIMPMMEAEGEVILDRQGNLVDVKVVSYPGSNSNVMSMDSHSPRDPIREKLPKLIIRGAYNFSKHFFKDAD